MGTEADLVSYNMVLICSITPWKVDGGMEGKKGCHIFNSRLSGFIILLSDNKPILLGDAWVYKIKGSRIQGFEGSGIFHSNP